MLIYSSGVEGSPLQSESKNPREISNPRPRLSKSREISGSLSEGPGISSPRSYSETRQAGLSETTPRSPGVIATLAHAEGVVHQVGITHDQPGSTKEGEGMLSDLRDEFLESKYDFDKIKTAVRKSRREEEKFYVPTEPVGRMFVQCKRVLFCLSKCASPRRGDTDGEWP
jgi:hypothetical protein